jgi:death-on-curing protein
VKRAPRWLSREFLLAIHARLLAEHGGAEGVRDAAALDSVLAAPRNQAAYGDGDVFDFAAAYAHSLLRLHPFVDGNKRVALVAAGSFLEWNGQQFAASESDAVAAVLALVTKSMSPGEFASWLRWSCGAGPARQRARPKPARGAPAKRRTRRKD